MSELPPVTPGSEHFWEGTRRRELVLLRCVECRSFVHPPRPRCPFCSHTQLEPRAFDGEPTLYSWAHHPARGDATGRMVILVDLTDGVRITSNLLVSDDQVPLLDLTVGEELDLEWQPLDDGRALPVFARRTGSTT